MLQPGHFQTVMTKIDKQLICEVLQTICVTRGQSYKDHKVNFEDTEMFQKKSYIEFIHALSIYGFNQYDHESNFCANIK